MRPEVVQSCQFPMKNLSIKVPESLDVRLSSAAKKAGVRKSEIVRKAIESYLGAQVTSRRGSCLDFARDLAGRLLGTKDLSSNKKRMRGYGR